MLSDSDFFWGFVFPLLVMGFVFGFVIFVAIPWCWPFIKMAILWSLT